MRSEKTLQNETAKKVVKEVLKHSPIGSFKDFRFPAAVASACLGISVVLGLFTVIAQRSDQNKRTDQLVGEIIKLEERATQAEARAAQAAEQSMINTSLIEANNSILRDIAELTTNVDRLLADSARDAAQRQPLIDAAIKEIISGVQSGNRDIETALADIRILLESNAATLRKVESLVAEAEANAASEGRRSATLPKEESYPTTTTSTTLLFSRDEVITLPEE